MTSGTTSAGGSGNLNPSITGSPFGNIGTGALVSQYPTSTGGVDAGSSVFNADPRTLENDIIAALIDAGIDMSQMSYTDYQQLLYAVMKDPYVMELASQAGEQLWGASTSVPSPFITAIEAELTDPTRTHSPLLLGIGLGWIQRTGGQLSATQQGALLNSGVPAGANPSVLTALAAAAAATGVPYNLALATAITESNLDPNAVGDDGCSHGLFQLNTCGGEGAGMTLAEMQDPYTNAVKALSQFKAVADANPAIKNDYGAWAAAAQRPADPSGYAARVNANMSGASMLGQAGSGSASPSAIIPKPFDAPVVKTLTYGQTNPWGINVQWTEYSMPTGTPVYTPFAGTIMTKHDEQGWGTQVFVKMANGYTYHVGHMHSLSVADGQMVNPGTVLGESGGSPSADGNQEWSTGPHIDITLQDPSGKYVNDGPIMDAIFSGSATFASLGMQGAEGAGVSASDAQSRILGQDPMLEAKYPQVVSEFNKYFGRHPTAMEITNILGAVGSSPDTAALDAYFDTLPSHVKGVSMGEYNDIKANADSVSNQMYGHSVTDGQIEAIAQSGMGTSQDAVKYWLIEQDEAGKMDPGAYQAIWKLNQPYMQGIYNQPYSFDPSIAVSQQQVMQEMGIPPPSSPKGLAPTPSGSPYTGGVNQPGKTPLGAERG